MEAPALEDKRVWADVCEQPPNLALRPPRPQVWSEVVGPFAFIPRSALQASQPPASRPLGPGHGGLRHTLAAAASTLSDAASFRPMQGTGNAVMGALMTTMLPVFMRKLSDDYVRWAGDAAYRARRAAASRPAALTAPH